MANSIIKKESAERLVLSISANTYSTYALALAAMETAYNTLTDAQKRNSYITVGSSANRYNLDTYTLKFYLYVGAGSDGLVSEYLDLKNHKFIKYKLTPSAFTNTDASANAQASALTLYTIL